VTIDCVNEQWLLAPLLAFRCLLALLRDSLPPSLALPMLRTLCSLSSVGLPSWRCPNNKILKISIINLFRECFEGNECAGYGGLSVVFLTPVIGISLAF